MSLLNLPYNIAAKNFPYKRYHFHENEAAGKKIHVISPCHDKQIYPIILDPIGYVN
jgi:hypothetical protein